MSDIAISVGKRIRAFREDARISRETLAERADLHPTYLGQLERGEKNATLESISKVAHGLKVPIEYLIEENPDSNEKTTLSQCYRLIADQPLKDQKHIYELIKLLVNYKNN